MLKAELVVAVRLRPRRAHPFGQLHHPVCAPTMPLVCHRTAPSSCAGGPGPWPGSSRGVRRGHRQPCMCNGHQRAHMRARARTRRHNRAPAPRTCAPAYRPMLHICITTALRCYCLTRHEQAFALPQPPATAVPFLPRELSVIMMSKLVTLVAVLLAPGTLPQPGTVLLVACSAIWPPVPLHMRKQSSRALTGAEVNSARWTHASHTVEQSPHSPPRHARCACGVCRCQ